MSMQQWIGLLIGLWVALPLAAEELAQIDPLSGMSETLQLVSFSSPVQRHKYLHKYLPFLP